MVLPPSRHEPGCDCRVGILECHDLQTVHPPMALDLPLVFEEIVLREWEIGLPTADELDLLCLLAG